MMRDALGNVFGIEVQTRRQSFHGNRALYVLSRLVTTHLKVGQRNAAVYIDLLAFDVYPESRALWEFAYRDDTMGDVKRTDRMGICMVEMPKYERLEESDSRLSDWVRFFRHFNDEKVMAAVTTPEVRQAHAALVEMASDDGMRRRLFEEEMRQREPS
jgi:hypothetical protein